MNRLRCAVSTRRSGAEGLEQSVNGVDAQREVTAGRIRDKIAAPKAQAYG